MSKRDEMLAEQQVHAKPHRAESWFESFGRSLGEVAHSLEGALGRGFDEIWSAERRGRRRRPTGEQLDALLEQLGAIMAQRRPGEYGELARDEAFGRLLRRLYWTYQLTRRDRPARRRAGPGARTAPAEAPAKTVEAASAGSTGPTGDDAPVASPRAAAEAEAMAALAELDTGGPADDEHEPGEYEDLGLLDADEAADGEQGDEKRGSEEK